MNNEQFANNDYARAIAKYGFYVATPIGTSMLPLLHEGEDTVKLVAPKDVIENDVLLYQRTDGTFVLHRLIKIEIKDGHTTYFMCGDNQYKLEPGIKPYQVIAKMEGYYKGEEYIPNTDPEYQKYVKKIVGSRKCRAFKAKLASIFK